MPLPGVALGYRAFRLPRQGHGLEECQDALAADAERGRFAIADGAAESPYSSLWAQLLVEEFVRQKERLTPWASWIPSAQDRWAAACSLRENRKRLGETSVPWYLEEGLRQANRTRLRRVMGFVENSKEAFGQPVQLVESVGQEAAEFFFVFHV